MPSTPEDFLLLLLMLLAFGVILAVTLPVWWWTLKMFVSIIKALPKIFWWITDRLR